MEDFGPDEAAETLWGAKHLHMAAAEPEPAAHSWEQCQYGCSQFGGRFILELQELINSTKGITASSWCLPVSDEMHLKAWVKSLVDFWGDICLIILV